MEDVVWWFWSGQALVTQKGPPLLLFRKEELEVEDAGAAVA